jgi:sterol 3beta-glucosyltransferase
MTRFALHRSFWLQTLQKAGHRVRIGTHKTFQSFVEGAGLEHFDIGGDPESLMAFMVKNPGLIPGVESLRNGDIPKQKKQMAEILQGCYRSCFEPGQGAHQGEPFAADLIIANPPSFAHVHLAEAFNLPLHMVFTFPYGPPTTTFPHPLVNIAKSELTEALTNYISYNLFDLFTFSGLKGVINAFREDTLGLPALSMRSGQGLLDRQRLPWTYMWNSTLLPKPQGWKSRPIDIVGFLQTYTAPSYTPPDDLSAFLKAGDKPIYIGFGSIPMEKPLEMTKIIYEASAKAGVRVLMSAGWAKLGAGVDTPKTVLILGDVPHDWLFGECAAAVHHGGSGTTCASLRAGLPTLVVPFFGDQFHWGQAVAERGAGPTPIPARVSACRPLHEGADLFLKTMTVDNLAEALQELLKPAVKSAAEEVGKSIKAEKGLDNALRSIYRHLPLNRMRCQLLPHHAAQWVSPTLCLALSGAAVETLVKADKISYDQLVPHRVRKYATRAQITDPVTGGIGSILELVLDYHVGIFQSFYNPKVGIPKHVGAVSRQKALRSELILIDSAWIGQYVGRNGRGISILSTVRHETLLG